MPRSVASPNLAAGSNRNRGVLMLAPVFGVLSAALVLAFLNSRGGDDSALNDALNSGASESAVVVTRDIPAGTRVTSDMVGVANVPVPALLAGRVQKQEDVVGKVTTAPLFKDEQVIAAKITTFEGQNTLAYKVPDGMRAIAVQVPHEAWIVGGLIQPGDRIDFVGLTTLMRTDPLTGSDRPDVVAGIIAQNVEVLAASQVAVKKVVNVDAQKAAASGATPAATAEAGPVVATDANGKPLGDPDTYQAAISVTLALTPELAAKVSIIDAMKDDVGQYRLVLRQKGDNSEISGTTLWSFDEIFKKK